MTYGKKGHAAKVSSRMGKGRAGHKTVLSSPYQHVIADIHKGRGRGGKKR
jgi:hypothetical protein